MEYKIIAKLEYNDDDDQIYVPNDVLEVNDSNVAVSVCIGNANITLDMTDEELKELAKKVKAFRIREGDDISIYKRYDRYSNSHTIFISVNGETVGYFKKEWSR